MFVNIITKYSPPRLIKKSFFKHSAKFEFSKGINPRFWCRIEKFSLGYFLGKKFLTIKFINILKKKGEFQDNENYLNIIVKLEFFQRGWPMIFDKKQKIFPSLVLGIINLEILFQPFGKMSIFRLFELLDFIA